MSNTKIIELRNLYIKNFIVNSYNNNLISETLKNKLINEIDNPTHSTAIQSEFDEQLNNLEQEFLAQPWNKLNIVYKKRKIEEYIDEKIKDKTYDKKNKNGILELLNNAIDEKLINTQKSVKYDQVKKKIIDIPVLINKNGKFSLKKK